MEIDKNFPKKWPFGMVMTAQWMGCFALLVTLYCSPYSYSGTSFVFFCAWTMLLVALLTWVVHLLGIQKRTLTVGQVAMFIPFAMLLFGYSMVFFVLFCISTLICLISMFSSIGYVASLFFVYLFGTIFSLFDAVMCGYMAILLYRNTPNGLLVNLKTLVIEGDKTTTFGATSVNSGATSIPGVFAQGTNAV